jgi:LPXTG-site transpeptidase (sortase) family protein
VPAHRRKQTGRNALYTAVVVAVAVFVAIIGFGGSPRHSSPTADANTASPSASATATPAATTAGPTAPTASKTPANVVKPTVKPRPAATSTGLGTSDASLKALAQQMQAQPVQIQIPALHVNAPVIPVGVTSSGALQVPDNVTQAAWYQAGNAPGQGGLSIIAAHVDFDGKLGLFNELHTLKKGDLIIVTDYSRHIHRYKAVTGRLFPKSDPSTVQALAQASSKSGQPELALITCGGALNSAAHSYYDNFVLLANA